LVMLPPPGFMAAPNAVLGFRTLAPVTHFGH
jgi:hypothetical protein